MAKQQTLTIIVDDDMADPLELIESAFGRYLQGIGQVIPEAGDDPIECFDRGEYAYMILEED